MNEHERIALLRRIFEEDAPPGASTVLGIGDDAAVLAFTGSLVVSVDAVVEHVHFERAWLTLEDLGFKAAMGALSDLAAMGAAPVGVLASWVLPPGFSDVDLDAVARGQAAACRAVGARIVGGNLSRGAELGLHTTVLGRGGEAILRRDGARPGDEVLAAGDLGLAAAGLSGLRAGDEVPDDWAAAWRRPRARIEEGRRAAGIATAAIDVSDGLAADIAALARASGVAVVLDAAALVSESLRVRGSDALALVLHGGEDYALVVTSAAPIDGFRRIGVCEPGAGVWLQRDGAREEVGTWGWDHFTR